MTREFKLLLSCNLVVLGLATAGCYFAFEAWREAKSASFAADWGASNAASRLDELSKVVDGMASDLELVSADAKARASVERLMPGY
ncbi:hypothetical protein AAUI01_08220 [Pseudomonas mosselii]|uniref:hypothetical protein n=1 Tax=Pseudomonas mosselii TaxID=78327 RepID=UPI0032E52DBA